MSLGSVTARNLSLAACYGDGHSSAFPNTVYLAGFHGDPATTGVEMDPADGGYERLAVENDSTHFAAPSAGSQANAIDFNMLPASDAWTDSVTHWAYMSLATAGDVLDCGLIVDADGNPAPFTVSTPGDQISFPAGSLVVTA